MEIQCKACFTKYKVTQPKFEGKQQVKIRCKKCQQPIIIQNPDYDDDWFEDFEDGHAIQRSNQYQEGKHQHFNHQLKKDTPFHTDDTPEKKLTDDDFDNFDFPEEPKKNTPKNSNDLKNRLKAKKNRQIDLPFEYEEQEKPAKKLTKKQKAALKKQQEQMKEWGNQLSYRDVDQIRREKAEKEKLERYYENYIPEHFLLPHNRIDAGSLVLRLMLILSFLPIVATIYYYHFTNDLELGLEVVKMTYLLSPGSEISAALQQKNIFLNEIYSFMFAKMIMFLTIILTLVQSAKRCHDIGLSGRFFWLILLPGPNLLLFLKGSEKQDNRFGGYKQ